MRAGIWIGLALALVVYAAFVVANNAEVVGLNLLFVQLEAVPVWQLLLLALLLGVAVATLLLSVPLVRLRLRVRSSPEREEGAPWASLQFVGLPFSSSTAPRPSPGRSDGSRSVACRA